MDDVFIACKQKYFLLIVCLSNLCIIFFLTVATYNSLDKVRALAAEVEFKEEGFATVLNLNSDPSKTKT